MRKLLTKRRAELLGYRILKQASGWHLYFPNETHAVWHPTLESVRKDVTSNEGLKSLIHEWDMDVAAWAASRR